MFVLVVIGKYVELMVDGIVVVKDVEVVDSKQKEKNSKDYMLYLCRKYLNFHGIELAKYFYCLTK